MSLPPHSADVESDGPAPGPSPRRAGWPTWGIVLVLLGPLAIVVPVVAHAFITSGQRDDREAAVKYGLHTIQVGVDLWASMHTGTYPDPSRVDQVGLASYVDEWPVNPYTGAPMARGTAAGDFSYAVGPGGASFKLVGWGRNGAAFITLP